MSLVCISNDVPGVRNCVHRGEHLEGCTGERHGKECRGCLPRKADQGMLCVYCYEELLNVLGWWPTFATTITTNGPLVNRDNAGISSKAIAHDLLTLMFLDVNEAEDFLQSYTRTGDVRVWVSNHAGAVDAVKFMQVAKRARNTHQVEERPHRVTRVRCRECGETTLVWMPPEHYRDEVTVKCSKDGCGFVLDQAAFEWVALAEEKA
jgi:hypothetical protein